MRNQLSTPVLIPTAESKRIPTQQRPFLGGILLGLSPTALLVPWPRESLWMLGGELTGLLSFVLLLVAAGRRVFSRRLASAGLGVGLASWLLSAYAGKTLSPEATLLSLVLASCLLYSMWCGPETHRQGDFSTVEKNRADYLRGALLAAMSLPALRLFSWDAPARVELVMGLSSLVVIVQYLRLVRLTQPQPKIAFRLLLPALLLALSVAQTLAPFLPRPLPPLTPPVQLLLLLSLDVTFTPLHSGARRPAWLSSLLQPERLLIGTFAALCAIGTLLLRLPAAAERPITLLEAAFTAVSAVCVTGLSVIDVGRELTFFGELLLLTLIQAGGLGILTFSAAAAAALGQRLSLRQEGALSRLLSGNNRAQLMQAAQRIIAFTLVAELFGAVLLTYAFLGTGGSFSESLWRGVFTAISAFCNAGFALQSDSLISYNQNSLVLYTTSLMIVLGGLSPLAWLSLRFRKGALRRLPLEHKLAFTSSLVLLILGAVGVALFEWEYGLSGLPWPERLHNSFFHSATLRTAGFNSLAMEDFRPATLILMLALMFVGGSPGSTAGGIKTTTAAVVSLTLLAVMRNRQGVHAFGRQLPPNVTRRAATVAILGFLAALAVTMLLLLTQRGDPGWLLFEVFSALGTVGLTLGATPQLDELGQILIGLCMFVGRVGGLTFFMFLAQADPHPEPNSPLEDVQVG